MKKAWAWGLMALALAIFGVWLFRFVFTAPGGNAPVTPAARKAITIHWLDDSAYAQEEIDDLLGQWGRTNGVNVQVEHVSGNYDILLKTRINAGKLPDIWVNRAGAENGMFAEYAYDWAQEPIVQQFDVRSLALCRDGEAVVGLPGAYEAYGLIYNKRLFEKAGIDRAPETLPELEQACAALQTAGILPFYNGYKEARVLSNLASQFYVPLRGAGLFAEAVRGDALFAYLDLTLAYGQPNPLETDWRAAAQAIAKGEAAMTYMGNWCETTIRRMDPYASIGLAALPVSQQREDARLLTALSGVWKLNRNSPHLAQTKELLTFFLTSEQGMALHHRVYGDLPIAKATDSAQDAFLSGWPSGFGAKCPEILQSYLGGNLTLEETSEALEKSWREIVGNN